jgi:DNA-binding FadR family transcriptional regulator
VVVTREIAPTSSTQLAAYAALDEVDVFTPVWEYIYVNIARHIAQCIATSQLRPGQRLPSELELAEFYGVSINTQRRAMQLLRTHSLIVSRRGKGTYIAAGAKAGVVIRSPIDKEQIAR